MFGHGSKEVEESPEDKKLDAAKGVAEGSPSDLKFDKMIGRKMQAKKVSKRGSFKSFGKRY
jgi:hypothetical protein